MVLHLVNDLISNYLSIDELSIDNLVFKLFYKITFALFILGSLVGIFAQYIGDPINCDIKGIDSGLANNYCWIHGSNYIAPEYQAHMNCIVDLDGIESDSSDDLPDTKYYQWVTFLLCLQGLSCRLPYVIWEYVEGGLIKEFGVDAKSTIMLQDKDDEGNHYQHQALTEKYVKYFKSILHRNTYYFWKYCLCEAMNFGILFANFWITDYYLNGNFWYYGLNVLNFNRLGSDEQKLSVNPMCATFPLDTSCSLPIIGAAGGETTLNGICVLSQNIFNQKMYLVIWWWLTILICISPLCMIYRLVTMFFDPFRSALVMAQTGNTNDKGVRNAIKVVLGKCYLGDWFVLYQIGKNVNMYFFRAFIKELKIQISLRKKSSFIAKDKLDNKDQNNQNDDIEKDDKSTLLV